MDVADELVGYSSPCPSCGGNVSIRFARKESPKGIGRSCLGYFCSFRIGRPSAIVYFLLFFILVDTIGIGLAMLLPAIQAAREAAQRIQCSENLKRIGAAMQAYQQKHGRFPPAFVPDKNGKPMHSWRVLILPFLLEQNLHRRYRFDEPWNSPHNRALAGDMPAVYRCPGDDSDDRTKTSYAMIVGPHAVSDGPSSRRIGEIRDGGTGTIMVAEAADAGINWLEPRDLDVKDMTFDIHANQEPPRKRASDISSPHVNVIGVLFCNGKVGAVDKSVGEEHLREMMTADGNEPTAHAK
jgi:hypothetical protein